MATFTPWGTAQQSRKIAHGIMEYSTAGHGGIHLSEKRMEHLRSIGADKPLWAGYGWYEEDCDWCVPFLAFPEEFKAYWGDQYEEVLEIAKSTLRNVHPNLVGILIKEALNEQS
jgi:hypothetical protein